MRLDDLPPVQAFGTWDAPVTDDAVWIDTPIGERCMYCGEEIAEGDSGAIMPTGFVQHRECALRSAWGGIGHVVNHERYCFRDPDAGLGRRRSAILVWRHFVEHRPVTEAELEELRAGASSG